MLIVNYHSESVNLTNSNPLGHTVVTAPHSILATVIGLFVRLRSLTMKVQAGPALSMFEVFGRTGPQIFWRAAILDPNIPYKLSCQFELLWYLHYGANTYINAATRCVLWAYNTAKYECGPRCGSLQRSPEQIMNGHQTRERVWEYDKFLTCWPPDYIKCQVEGDEFCCENAGFVILNILETSRPTEDCSF